MLVSRSRASHGSPTATGRCHHSVGRGMRDGVGRGCMHEAQSHQEIGTSNRHCNDNVSRFIQGSPIQQCGAQILSRLPKLALAIFDQYPDAATTERHHQSDCDALLWISNTYGIHTMERHVRTYIQNFVKSCGELNQSERNLASFFVHLVSHPQLVVARPVASNFLPLQSEFCVQSEPVYDLIIGISSN